LGISFDNLDNSMGNVGYIYRNTSGQDGRKVLAGQMKWKVDEVEILHLTPDEKELDRDEIS
jgi:hypothetical protein